MSKLGLYARTIKRMKPTQVVGRLHRTRIVDVGGTPRLADGFSIVLRDTDLADNYLERFDVDLLVKSNTLLLLNSAYVVDSEAWRFLKLLICGTLIFIILNMQLLSVKLFAKLRTMTIG